ncbi:hypothetical protein CBR_g8390 [Chara braunii]|uniref:Peptidase A2 domain-containing protein n=1 Tax=Chara braunii TaxID=69332 RepID=A0A388KM19_CHABU|nr:hypothetical protein CBR_g8390 [Chara braunii]|eukprot:GBG71091.1 hypothetical protein CBR_g8390 [Chara braunii]
MPEEMADGGRKLLTLDDLIDALDKRERAPSNVPKVETFHFKGDRVSDWLDLTEQALVGLSDEVKLQRVLRYVLHSHHREVTKVVDAAGGSWTKFGDLMRRKYRLGDGLLTMADLEAMNKEDFSTIGAFVHEFKKKARKVHGISEEAQCATFLGLLTGSEATELTKYGKGSERLTWATIDKGVEEGRLDQVEQHQMRLQRRKRKKRDATASGTPGVKRIVTDVLAALGYDNEAEVQKRRVLVAQGRASRVADEEAGQEDYGGGETGPQGCPSVATVRAGPRSGMTFRPPTSHGRVPQAAQTRGQSKATTSQGPSQAPSRAPPRKDPEPERRKEVVEVPEEEDEGDDEEDERLRQEEDRREEQRAKKRTAQGGAEPGLHDGVLKRKKYAVRLEEGFDVERMVDKLLEGHNDLMNLKDILASAPRLRGELKGRLSRRLVPNVHLSSILPREIKWTETGTMMDWKCVAYRLVDLKVRDQPSIAMVDTGAEMNIIRERDATMLGLEVDHSDHGVLHGANCKAIFCGTASNVMVEIGRVRARTCFFVMPDVDHPILLRRSFLCRTETLIFNRHEGTMILALSDLACGNYEIIKCRNTGPGSGRNRLNLGSFTYEESEYAQRRLREEQEEEGAGEVLSLSLNDVNKAMEVVAAHDMADPKAIKALRKHVLENPQVGEVELIYRLPGRRGDPAMAQARTTRTHSLAEEVRTIEEGPTQEEEHEQLMGGMYLLTNTLLQGNFNQRNASGSEEGELLIPESLDDEFEEGEIREAFRAKEYDGIYRELGLLLSCEIRDRDASAKAQKMRHLYAVRSDFSKAVMQRGGRDTRPRQRLQRMAGGGEQHGPPRRELTPEFDDDNIELFLEGQEEPLDLGMAAKQPDSARLQGGEVITVGDDTPPCTPVPEPAQHSWPGEIPEPGSEEVRESPPEATTVQEAEAEGQGMCERARMEGPLDLPSAKHDAESPVIEEPVPVELPLAVPCTSERMRAEVSTSEGQESRGGRAPRETREEKSAWTRYTRNRLRWRRQGWSRHCQSSPRRASRGSTSCGSGMRARGMRSARSHERQDRRAGRRVS